MRGLLFPGHQAEFDLAEAGGFQPALHIAFGEAQPDVAIQVPGLPELMTEQIENQDLALRTKNPVGAADGPLGLGGMMQRLAQNDYVHTGCLDRRLLEIAQAEFQVAQSGFGRLGRPKLDNLLRVIHRNDPFAPPRKQLRHQSLARPEIGHRQGRQNPQQQLPEPLPTPARAIAPVEPTGDLVEEDLGLMPTQLQDAFQIDLVGGVLGLLARTRPANPDDLLHLMVVNGSPVDWSRVTLRVQIRGPEERLYAYDSEAREFRELWPANPRSQLVTLAPGEGRLFRVGGAGAGVNF